MSDFVNSFVCKLWNCLSVYFFICLFPCVFLSLSVCLSVSLSLRCSWWSFWHWGSIIISCCCRHWMTSFLWYWLSVHLSVWPLSVFVCLPVYPSVCVKVKVKVKVSICIAHLAYNASNVLSSLTRAASRTATTCSLQTQANAAAG